MSEDLYFLEIMWNREFHYVPGYGSPYKALEAAIVAAEAALDSGDGARVKGARVLDSNGDVVWEQ